MIGRLPMRTIRAAADMGTPKCGIVTVKDNQPTLKADILAALEPLFSSVRNCVQVEDSADRTLGKDHGARRGPRHRRHRPAQEHLDEWPEVGRSESSSGAGPSTASRRPGPALCGRPAVPALPEPPRRSRVQGVRRSRSVPLAEDRERSVQGASGCCCRGRRRIRLGAARDRREGRPADGSVGDHLLPTSSSGARSSGWPDPRMSTRCPSGPTWWWSRWTRSSRGRPPSSRRGSRNWERYVRVGEPTFPSATTPKASGTRRSGGTVRQVAAGNGL